MPVERKEEVQRQSETWLMGFVPQPLKDELSAYQKEIVQRREDPQLREVDLSSVDFEALRQLRKGISGKILDLVIPWETTQNKMFLKNVKTESEIWIRNIQAHVNRQLTPGETNSLFTVRDSAVGTGENWDTAGFWASIVLLRIPREANLVWGTYFGRTSPLYGNGMSSMQWFRISTKFFFVYVIADMARQWGAKQALLQGVNEAPELRQYREDLDHQEQYFASKYPMVEKNDALRITGGLPPFKSRPDRRKNTSSAFPSQNDQSDDNANVSWEKEVARYKSSSPTTNQSSDTDKQSNSWSTGSSNTSADPLHSATPVDLLDDASPTRPDSHDNSTPVRGAWERLRQKATRNEASSSPREQRNNEPQGDSFSFSSSMAEREMAKEEAQKDFDARLDRERQGQDFDDKAGKRWK
ncbi:hypothetical protein BT63DRAFT_306852 [Microthyrium microscopicum]|uniref:Uncharacterized protein n=1 Tax=Microthyrium microscopicum TaxID=703497 RepID=A0A6A6U6Z1_9PEZI|nr:hypothetical protein BT63DRAFT_306852 [Microthyrium microscopicum]